MKLGIQQKIAISFSVFLFIVSCISGWLVIAYATRVASENIQQQQFAMTELIARSIDDKLGTNLANIAQIATEVPAEAFRDPEKAQTFLDSHRNMISVFDNGLLLVDSNYSLVAETPFIKGRRGMRLERLMPFLQSVVAYGLADISNPYISPKSNEPAIVMAVPITDDHDHLQGFLIGSIHLTKDYFLEEVMGYKIGKKGYLYLFNTERTMILHPDKSRILKHDIPPGADKLLDRAIAGFEGGGETVNSQGVAQIASFKRLRMVDWILAAAYPQDEVYAPIKRLRNYLIAAATGVTLLSIVLIWLLTRRITANLSSFTAQIRQISENPENYQEISIKSTDEVSLLATTFNSLLQQLNQARAALDQLSRTDHLTGLNNRRHLAMEAPKLLAISERQKALAALFMIDIDHFKQINDSHGHKTGDTVLVHLAKMLRLAVRPYDLVVRYGGEEFLLLLPLTTGQDATDVAERLRLDIQHTPVATANSTISFTVSIGVYMAEQIVDLNDAIARADAALYDAKNNGRNQVCLVTT